jgi:hypothetical protein
MIRHSVMFITLSMMMTHVNLLETKAKSINIGEKEIQDLKKLIEKELYDLEYKEAVEYLINYGEL